MPNSSDHHAHIKQANYSVNHMPLFSSDKGELLKGASFYFHEFCTATFSVHCNFLAVMFPLWDFFESQLKRIFFQTLAPISISWAYYCRGKIAVLIVTNDKNI